MDVVVGVVRRTEETTQGSYGSEGTAPVPVVVVFVPANLSRM